MTQKKEGPKQRKRRNPVMTQKAMILLDELICRLPLDEYAEYFIVSKSKTGKPVRNGVTLEELHEENLFLRKLLFAITADNHLTNIVELNRRKEEERKHLTQLIDEMNSSLVD